MRARPASFAIYASLYLACACPRASHALWPHDPTANLPVCTATGDQQLPVAISDGAGGAFVAWWDKRSGTDIPYAQHVLASGAVDPAWPANGRALTTTGYTRLGGSADLAMVADGAGGAIIAWADYVASLYHLRAQHVLAAGIVDPAWPTDGRALCTDTPVKSFIDMASDEAGGAIVVWMDSRGGTNSEDLYAQRVRSTGALDPAWPADGLAFCTAPRSQQVPHLIPDGAGGAIITWQDDRATSDSVPAPARATSVGVPRVALTSNVDIYAHHVLASGAVDPAWPSDGRAVCAAASNQYAPEIISDGAGGAIIAWMDNDIYAHHLLVSGVLDPTWPAGGRTLCIAPGDQQVPTLVTDGAGGAIVTWQDGRNYMLYDIYAQHVLASSVVDPAWPADGRALTTTGAAYGPIGVSDGEGGAFVTWSDSRDPYPNWDIYAHHVLASGAVDPAWPTNGRAISSAALLQWYPTIVPDNVGGAILAWEDKRGGSNSDIYAQRVSAAGQIGDPEPVVVSVRDVPNDNGGRVKLSWTASFFDTDPPYFVHHYRVFRSVPPAVASGAPGAGARIPRTRAGAPEPDLILDTHALPGVVSYSWEFLAKLPAAHFTSNYSYVAATTMDSTGAGNPKTAFMVVAYDSSGLTSFPSAPDSGYSVDNLAPAVPAALSAFFDGVATRLHWAVSPEPDFAAYHLHRGDAPGFAPGPGNLLVAKPDTGYVDTGSAWAYYKLSALDVHGNESPYAATLPTGNYAGYTPAGDSIPVSLPSVALTFQKVTNGGQTQLTFQTGGPAPPTGFELMPTSPRLYYTLTTTATFTGLVTVCVNYDPSYVTGKENKLKISVFDTGTNKWVNITTTRDTVANVICGTTTHFSDFAVMIPLDLVAVDEPAAPALRLYPCSPNPTAGGAGVRFALPREAEVSLGIYDAGGRRIRELARGVLPAGAHALRWDGRDDAGRRVANGLYLVRLECDGVALTQKLVTMR